VVDQRRPLAAALGHAELEAGQGLFHDQPPDPVPLVVVAVQQPRSGLPVQDRGQLPGQVVGVLDAGAAPQPAGRGDDAGRVPDQEHPTGPVAAGQVGADGEPQHLQVGARDLWAQPDLQVGQAGGGPDQLGDPLVGEVLQRVLVGPVAGAEHPVQPGVVVGHEDGARAGSFQVGDRHRPAPQGRVQVGVDQGRDGVEQGAGAVGGEAEALADRAVGPVGGDQVVGPDGA
jgi:hypothetical protein